MTEMPLNGKDYLSDKYWDLPLHALSYSLSERVSMILNKDIAPREDGTFPNFGGLADRIGFDGIVIDHCRRQPNPGLEVLSKWKNRQDLCPTLGKLVEHLAYLDREDILTDCSDMMKRDAQAFVQRTENFNSVSSQPLQDSTVSSGPGDIEDNPALTMGDITEKQVIYFDAFVSYAYKDLAFVKEIIRRLEEEMKLRLFVPGRDNLVGMNEHKITARIISERCRHMIVVLSPNYVGSEACNFQCNYAFSLSPAARDKRIVPILIEDCQVPEILRIMACCNFINQEFWDWSWNRLIKSVMPTPMMQTAISELSHRASSSPFSNQASSVSAESGIEVLSSYQSSSSSQSGAVAMSASSRAKSDNESSLSSASNQSETSNSDRSPSLGSRALQHLKGTFTQSSKKQKNK